MRFALALMLLAIAAPAAAASAKQTTLSGKAGKTNVQVRVILHPQVDSCAPDVLKEIHRQALALGLAHVRANLAKLVRQAKTDASGEKEFFGLSYLAGCPKDGAPWLAFPADGKEKSVSRYAPGAGWSPMMKL
ncbi:hypothetical protein [Hansschlegelia zhihuaiae]|uniref:Uncharacterized protein n=1 Tax=Hansschlegelia zhihuaiae TaxID=405005 RepID=A0A4Q0MCE8_9HYPH|nr:hypothetical protein [Hansschlegelia zhihuaiae]RXF70773.1 hypothetical protein EK403_16435 [Hansschlegelia zhihuaiae]